MKEIKLKGTFHEMGKQYGKACEKDIKTFAKMAYLMISLSKKPGSQPFNPNMWYFIPTLSQPNKEERLLVLPLLRTGLATFITSGSSLS